MFVILNINILLYFSIGCAVPVSHPKSLKLPPTRRVLGGHEVFDTRPYMVYLRASSSSDPEIDSNWLCGGVIIHESYILTSAACIENAKHFYVVSGTHRWIPPGSRDDCITNGAKRAVWKCVPKSYVFDGHEFDNIKWMINDIAVVKVEEDFNFERRVIGCDFIPKKIAYNNISEDLEKAGSMASIAGWGSADKFGDSTARSSTNSPVLLETEVALISKKNCKKRWEQRYHHIIDDAMICSKDTMDETMSLVCREHEVNCQEMVYSDEDEQEKPSRRQMIDPKQLNVHFANHNYSRRSKPKVISGGFCENDHGGPLIVGHGKSAVVIGVISACLTRDITHKCYGPFLYASVWKNRQVISCAIDKDIATTCRKLLRSSKTQMSETVLDWADTAEEPPKSKVPKNRPVAGTVSTHPTWFTKK